MKFADDEFVSSIASNVMRCLASSSYFEKLDNLLSPEDNSGVSENCDGTYRLSESILQASGFVPDDLNDILAVLKSKGACCDCEVLIQRGREKPPQSQVLEEPGVRPAYKRHAQAALSLLGTTSHTL